MHDYFEQYIRAVKNPLPEMIDYFDKENTYIKSIVGSEGLVLDVGCGNGRTIKSIAPFVKKVVGIDYSEDMIRAARTNLKDLKNWELILANFFEMDPEPIYDVVLASYNLLGSSEVSTDRRDFLLSIMKQYAKPGGHVLASVWSDTGIDFAHKYYPAIGINIKEIRGNDVITDHGNFKRFIRKEIEDLAAKVADNFKIISLTDIFYLLDIIV